MSFWDNVKKFTQPYAEDEYDDYDDDGMDTYEEEAPRSSRRASASATESTGGFGFGSSGTSTTGSAPSSGFSGQVVNINSNKQEVVLFRPSTFDDASKAADDLRDKKAIIVNMENVDKTMARRVVDFLSGCAYALDGKVKKIAQATYLFCPHSMAVVGDLENIQSEVESYI